MGVRDKYLPRASGPLGVPRFARRMVIPPHLAGVNERIPQDRRRIGMPRRTDTRVNAAHRSAPDGKWLHDMFPGASENNNAMDIETPMTDKAPAKKPSSYDRVGALGAARLLRKSAESSATTGVSVDREARAIIVDRRQARIDMPPDRRLRGTAPGRRARSAQDDDAIVVKISNLDFSIMENDLKELCKRFGDVVRVWIEYDRFDRSTGVGKCIFKKYVDAVNAVKNVDGKLVEGRNIEAELIDNASWNFGNSRRTRGGF
eukprot:GHVQ01004835.1.p1 GENE.GHVQ01004835.1~~GHVQ01004835.1.p1  ORF type:complete len:260 (-),score=16.04 GHVQ01004835.1:1474-2253(-)